MRKDLQLPSIATLTRITSTYAKNAHQVCSTLCSPRLRIHKKCASCWLMKFTWNNHALQFHGGEVFGKAANNSCLLAYQQHMPCWDTWLTVFMGSRFSIDNDPVSKLNADFLNQEVEMNVRDLSNSSVWLKVIICDGNRTKQSFFKK